MDMSKEKHMVNNLYMKARMKSLFRYFRKVRLPPQNSAKAKKVGGRSTVRKSPIGSTNNQWGMKKNPTD